MPQGLSDAAVDLSRVAVSNDAGATASTNTGTAGSTGSGTATVHATPVNYDAEWLCPVTVGGQTLNLNFDTGSSDLYVSISFPPFSLFPVDQTLAGGCIIQVSEVMSRPATRSTILPNPRATRQ